jgi:outer membrane lipoprotein-sorting protein
MRLRLAACVAVCGFGLTGQVAAATLPAPSVEYSADRTIESATGTFTGKVYSAKDKERAEMNMSGMQSVMILRRDKQLGWMLMPAQKMYMTMDFAKAQKQSGAAPDDQVEITEVGSETIEGLSAKKYKMVMKDGSAGGFIWVTGQGIPVKMDMLSKSGGEKTRMTITLKNLQIGSQDAQMFELPSGYTAMPSMGAFGARQ